MHALIDSNIYRQDRRRNKRAFRALLRLAKAGRLQLHIPIFVKGEILTQEQQDTRDEIDKISGAAAKLLRISNEPAARQQADELEKTAKSMRDGVDDRIAAALEQWIGEAQAIVHPVAADHGARVADSYFSGKAPFRTAKFREDIPDSFIWETALDLVRAHGELIVISHDGRLRAVAEEHQDMSAYKSLNDFIEDDDCQDALTDLTPEIVAENVARIKKLLPATEAVLLRNLQTDIVDELAWKTVRHDAIPDDNNEATIVAVGAPENVEFNYKEIDHDADADLSIHFTATVDCDLNYAIYKGDYYILDETEGISIDERNDHYFDAEQNYTLTVEGYLSLMLDSTALEEDNLSDKRLLQLIDEAPTDIEITERSVSIPGW